MKNEEVYFDDVFDEILQKRYIDVDANGLVKHTKKKKKSYFNMRRETSQLDNCMKHLPTVDECFKFISVQSGFSTIAFIKAVAEKEIITDLLISSVRIGQAKLLILDELYKRGRIKNAYFIVNKLFKQDMNRKPEYNYFKAFDETCKENNWSYDVAVVQCNIILMKTESDYYVLETSSNLSETPHIDQFSFENDKEVYEFYASFFYEIEANKHE